MRGMLARHPWIIQDAGAHWAVGTGTVIVGVIIRTKLAAPTECSSISNLTGLILSSDPRGLGRIADEFVDEEIRTSSTTDSSSVWPGGQEKENNCQFPNNARGALVAEKKINLTQKGNV